MAKILVASPGTAGRNKTLNLTKMEAIHVPIPDMEKQKRFAEVYSCVQPAAELETLMPAALEKAFAGVL